MRVLLAAIECGKGTFDANLRAHLELVDRACREQVELVVFPEFSLTGYVDPVQHPEQAVTLDHPIVQALVEATRKTVAVVFGIAEQGDPDVVHITQVFAFGGRILGRQRKRHLGEGEEAFTPAPIEETSVFTLGSVRTGSIICAESTVDHTWDATAAAGADLIAFSSAPGLYGPRNQTDDDWRGGFEWWESAGLADAQRHARRLGVWVAMATQAGATHDEDFPGIAALIAPDGTVVDRLPDWRPGVLCVDLPLTVDVEPVRWSIRTLVVDERGAALLCQFRNTVTGHTWWVPPGGGMEAGEDDLACARREMAEELGRDDLDVGPCIGGRGGTFLIGDDWFTQHERWYLVRCPRFEVDVDLTASLGSEGIRAQRWWTAEELRAEGVDTAPRNLADLLDRVNAGDLPAADAVLGF